MVIALRALKNIVKSFSVYISTKKRLSLFLKIKNTVSANKQCILNIPGFFVPN